MRPVRYVRVYHLLHRHDRAESLLPCLGIERLFKPRGLFALVVAYKPDAKKQVEVGEFDSNVSIARFSQPADSAWSNKARILRTDSGKQYNELNVGEVAPLIYPSLEEAKLGATEEQKGKWKKFEKFMGEYGDRRAQAVYVSFFWSFYSVEKRDFLTLEYHSKSEIRIRHWQ